MPAWSVPNAIVSIAVTTVKYTPPKTAVPRIARGMSRRGWWASSPSVAAASNPAKDSRPNTIPRNSVELSVPGATVNTDIVKVAPPGASPPSSRTSTTAATTRISSTVRPSTVSSSEVARRAGTTVSSRASTSASPPTRKPAHHGWSFHTPTASRNAAPKIPAAEEVTRP